jgi:hypothetical protein
VDIPGGIDHVTVDCVFVRKKTGGVASDMPFLILVKPEDFISLDEMLSDGVSGV